MKGHVFIVNEETLPIHLEHMFVGVSSGGGDNNIALLSDILRVKEGDFIFFYIEGREDKKGRFFGIFKALENTVYHLTGNDANNPNLPVYIKKGKRTPLKLIYRKRVQPYKVYAKGVLEWVALDKLPTYSKELLWTLIYRKMKGKRGNTMLFPWETERLISLIEDENQGKLLDFRDFTIDRANYEITGGNDTYAHNIGNPITVSPADIKRSETHLQAYILQNLGLYDNKFFPEIFGKSIVWIGNEVFAGTGMQKIDIITIEKIDETSSLYRLIELKHPKSTTNVSFAPMQLDYYVNWAREDIGGHVIGGKRFNVKPILVTLTPKFNAIPDDIVSEINNLNTISTSPEVWEMDLSLNTLRRP